MSLRSKNSPTPGLHFTSANAGGTGGNSSRHSHQREPSSAIPGAHEMNIVIPVNAQPTEVLANRFASWRKIIRALNVYFKEVASVQEEVVRHNIRLGHAVDFPFFANGTSQGGSVQEIRHQQLSYHDENEYTRQMFLEFGENSIADIPGNIIQFHRAQAAAASRASKELSQNVIPRLEDLRRDLVVKIKEIKNLSSDFKNSVSREQSATARELQQYVNSIDILGRNPSLLPAKHDPYLVKLQLDKQLNRQVNEENYLLEAFLNLQGSGKELEKVVSQEVQQALTVFGKLMGVQGKNLTDLMSNKILNGYVSQEATMEWDSFIDRDVNFVDPNLKPRKFSEIPYPHQDSMLATEVKSGYLERRSKYLKSYSRAWYVLTPSFLHEFKSPDRKRDPHPVMSLSLDECQLTQDHRKSSSSVSHKFILNAKQQANNGGGGQGKGHNWVFRAESKEKLTEWYTALSKLTAISNPVARAKSLQPSTPTTVQYKITPPQDGSRPSSQVIAAATATSPIQVPKSPRQTDELPVVSSPVPSDTSAVTSTGEPYHEEEEEDIEALAKEHDEYDDDGRVNTGTSTEGRGRFPSEVNLESEPVDADKAIDDETLHREAATFIVPNESTSAAMAPQAPLAVGDEDNDSVFSYDLEHPSASTYHKDGDDFKPVDSDLPVEVERKLTQTSHKHEDDVGIGPARKSTLDEPVEEAINQRRNSVKGETQTPERKPSRKATGSYGTDEGAGLKPLTNLEDQALFFAGGLPNTTGGKE